MSPADPITIGCRAVKSTHELEPHAARLRGPLATVFRAVFSSLRAASTIASQLRSSNPVFKNEFAWRRTGSSLASPRRSSRHDQAAIACGSDVVLIDGGCKLEGYSSESRARRFSVAVREDAARI